MKNKSTFAFLATIFTLLLAFSVTGVAHAAPEVPPIPGEVDLGKTLTLILIFVLPPLAAALVVWLVAQAQSIWTLLKDRNPLLANIIEIASHWAVKIYKQLEESGAIPHYDYPTIRDYLVKLAQMYIDKNWKGTGKVDLALIIAEIEKAIYDLKIEFDGVSVDIPVITAPKNRNDVNHPLIKYLDTLPSPTGLDTMESSHTVVDIPWGN